MRRVISTLMLQLFSLFVCLQVQASKVEEMPNGAQQRAEWIATMTRIVDPVLKNLANEELKAKMPFESLATYSRQFSYLEAFGRTLCGIAPWLELGPDQTKEGKIRAEYIDITRRAITNAVNPQSPDYMLFDKPSQPLVDAAFLAQGLLRAPEQLWKPLSKKTKEQVIESLKRSRVIKPFESNWLLFASMVEAALLEFTGEYDQERLMYGVKRFRDDWYKGDGQYGDGKNFHLDYYNSYVIHPMLTDVLIVLKKQYPQLEDGFLGTQTKRLSRYAEQLERFISPEGTFPVVGRSIVYRTGAFHALGQASLMHLLPKHIAPEQVRCAMTQVNRKMYGDHNFDDKGWLKIGLVGSQLTLSESYINTGSLYLCVTGFLPLGLPASDPFWSGPNTEWTNVKVWGGKPQKADKALKL